MPKNSKTTTSKTTKKTTAAPAVTTTDEVSAPTADAPGLTERQQLLLARLSPSIGISAAVLAAAAEIGRSTAQHDLVALENAGLGRREKGVQEGARRSPDQWFLAASDSPGHADAEGLPQEPDTADTDTDQASEPLTGAAADGTASDADSSGESEPVATAPEGAEANAAHDATGTGTATDAPEVNEPPAASTVDAPASTADPSGDSEQLAETPAATETDETPTDSTADDTSALGPEAAPQMPAAAAAEEGEAQEKDAVDAGAAPPATPPTSDTPVEATAERLGKGALRALVEVHLRAYPEQDFTAGQIGKSLTRSSGAVANALEKLVGEHVAEQTGTAPRTFRIAADAVSTQVDA
ncbi:hypothetical protein [Catenulispora subtropica]|uniref:HTH marR-type domain-containing protein n=1 Tax=Catenulispora subtropica TaxID=450798 RepID=A0ABN2T8A0_9ACTN